MVLGKLSAPGRPTNSDTSTTGLAVGASEGSRLSFLFFLSLSLSLSLSGRRPDID